MKTLGLLILIGLSVSAHAVDAKTSSSFDNINQMMNQFPVETAMANIYSQERLETLSVIIEGEPTVIKTRVIPKENTMFNNDKVRSAATSHLITSAKEADFEITSTYYFTLNPLKFYGFTNNLDDYAITTQTADIPKLANIGDSSEFAVDNIYTDSTQNTRFSTYTKTWALSRANNNTAWLCIDTSADLLSDDPDNTTSNCYSIDTQGELLSSKSSYSYSTIEGVKTISYISE